jgi:hypothetical protein
MTRLLSSGTCAILFLASAAGAQRAPAKGTSAIIGIAIDSLHKRPLDGAEVMVAGLDRTYITDSLGRFEIDSIPAGSYQVGLFHPLLDSLGISLASPKFSVGPDSVSVIRLSVPSAATLVAQTCKSRVRTRGNSAIFGRLMDPDTFDPIPHAEVSVVWMQTEVSKEFGVRETPRLIRDSTDANGAFRLCGLPSDLDARLQASYHGVVTADVPVTTASSDVDFLIHPLYVSRSDSAVGRAVVSGRVTFAGGLPAAESRVEIVGSKATGLTNEKGEFTLTGAPSGTQMLLVRHLGWEARELPLNLSVAKPQVVAVQLKKFVPMMDPVVVTARAQVGLEKVGFAMRQRGGAGRYITADEIARRQPTQLSDVLRTIPGLTVKMNGLDPEIVSTRGGGLTNQGCVTYFVDGMKFEGGGLGGDPNAFVNPREVAGIEIYQPTMVPGQFIDPSGAACTTIVVWTKQRVR